VRFISAEPLLGPVDVSAWLYGSNMSPRGWIRRVPLDWVIVGGESGPGARDCHVDWVRSLQGQCEVAGVPCFIKQLGRQPRVSDGVYLNLRDKKGGDRDEWPADLRIREMPR
jgi:protein gp37